MRTGTMRWLDHWAGLPLCALLGSLAVVVRGVFPRDHRPVQGVPALAVFKFFGLGSIIQATPLLRAIRRRHPNSRLVLLTFDTNEELLRRMDVCTDLRIIRTRSLFHFGMDVLRQIAWLRWNRVGAVVDLEFFSKFSTLLAVLSGAHVRVGFHLNDFWRRNLVTHPVYFNYFRHIGDIYAEVGAQLDAPLDDPRLSRLSPRAESLEQVRRFLADRGWKEGMPLLGVNVNAGEMSLERRWPVGRFAKVIDRLVERHRDLRIVLTGAPGEREYVTSVVGHLSAEAAGRVIVAAGEWSLDAFLAALELCDGFLSNDSGPMHMAAAQGVPLVSLWGPGRPEFYGPRVPHSRTLYGRYPCSPCLYMFTTFEGMWCNHRGTCMEMIPCEDVLDAVETMLAEAAARDPRGVISGDAPSDGGGNHGQQVEGE